MHWIRRLVAGGCLWAALGAPLAWADLMGTAPAPQSPAFREFDAGATHLLAGRLAEAEQAFRQSLRLRPGFSAALVGLSEVQVKQGKTAEAKASLQRALAAGKDDWLVQRAWARWQVRQKQFAAAETAYRAAVRLSPNSDTYMEMGDFYLLAAGKPQAAAEAYRSALAMDPGSTPARQALATALAAAGQKERSQQLFQETARLAPGDPYVLLAQGLDSHQRGELENALASLTRCIAAHPRFVAAYVARGNVFAVKNDYGKALADFSAALKLAPRSGQIHTSVGMLHLRAGRIDLAEAAFLNAIRLDAGQADAYNNLAWLAAERKTKAALSDALAWARKATALRPQQPSYLDTLGWVHQARGEVQAGIAVLEKAAAMAPRDREIARHLAALRARKSAKGNH